MAEITDKQICQVAFSALDGPALRAWYAQVFGFVRAGKIIFFPPSTSTVQGIPGAWEKCSWLIDQQDYFQLEFFQFLKPVSRVKHADRRPCDIGYNMIGIAVNDFDQVLRSLDEVSATDLSPIAGEPGNRRVCVADPEGNWIEIYERDPLVEIEGTQANIVRPELPAVVRTMRASVPSLEDARQAYVKALGLQVVEDWQLHTPEDEALWGLEGARASSVLVRGTNFLLELVEYHDPPARPWPPGYVIADQGFMNIALGYRDQEDYDRSFDRAMREGLKPNGKVVDIGVFRVMYVNDRHGFSVEMLHARKAFWSISGFNPREPYIENEINIEAPAAIVWQHLSDHASLGEWLPFKASILREGRSVRNGIGCLRELSAATIRITEEVTVWEEGRHYAYQSRAGVPFCTYPGFVFVTEKNGATQLRWAIRLESRIPLLGHLIAWVSGLALRRSLNKLKFCLES